MQPDHGLLAKPTHGSATRSRWGSCWGGRASRGHWRNEGLEQETSHQAIDSGQEGQEKETKDWAESWWKNQSLFTDTSGHVPDEDHSSCQDWSGPRHHLGHQGLNRGVWVS